MNAPLANRKLRGGYYTPEPIARFLAHWAIQSPKDSVLEPSCGDGNLLVQAGRRLLELGASPSRVAEQLYGVEIDPSEAAKAVGRLRELGLSVAVNNQIHINDFFAHSRDALFQERLLTMVTREGRLFSSIVGNPPFIRYQDFPDEHRAIAFELMEKAGLQPSGMTNAWVPFLVVSSLLLESQGRLGMVLPASLFQVDYASKVRQFLSDFYDRITLITFEHLVFDRIQQDVVLVLAEKDGMELSGIRSVELRDEKSLEGLTNRDLGNVEVKPMDHSTEKWTQYFLETEEIRLLRQLKEHPKLTMSGEVLEVNVGIVTGCNNFFILTQEEAEAHELRPYLKTIVSRSGNLQGAVFSRDDWLRNKEDEQAVFLFLPPDKPLEHLPQAVRDYIVRAELEGVHKGYKCRIRDRWYIVPSVWDPQAFMLRQVHDYPKLVLNQDGASCTDTIHRVRFKNGVDGELVIAAFLNSLTFAFSEVTGRSYGGGVLTFEPSEAQRLPLPLVGAEQIDLREIDKLLRKDNIEAVLNITDEILLVKGLGLGKRQVKALGSIWAKLRDRRINRK